MLTTTRAMGSLALLLVLASGCGDDGNEPAGGTANVTTGGVATTTTGAVEDPTTSTGPTPASTGGESSSDATGTPGDSSSGEPTGRGSESSTSGAAGPTWNNFGADFFEAYCSECHGAGDPEGRDYSTLTGVLPEVVSIRCGTGPSSAPPSDCAGEPPPEQFPIGMNTPTEAERILLVEWIDAGAPES